MPVWRAVLFDLGDTLIDNHPLAPAALDRLSARSLWSGLRTRLIHPPERSKLIASVNGGLADAARRYWAAGREAPAGSVFGGLRIDLAADLPDLAPGDLELMYLAPRLSRQRALSGAVDLLTSLQQAGVKLGLVSNCVFARESMNAHLHSLGLLGLLDAVVYSSTAGWRKPRPEAFAAALESLGVAAADAVMVGDDLRADVAGALDAGLGGAVWFWGRRVGMAAQPPGPAHGPGTWPDLTGWPEAAAAVDVLAVISAWPAGRRSGPRRLLAAAATLREVGALLGLAGH